MFDHPHHQKIHLILDSLDATIFDEVGALFGGGTLVTLLYGEYRRSKDVDFICRVGPGYRKLRELVIDNHHKPSFFFKKEDDLEFPRDVTANQYGIRFPVKVDGQPIKFEIVAEARIELEPPETFEWTQLPCLSNVDRFTEKLLANADRWADESIESRDLIDLAVMRYATEIPNASIDKAEHAYPVIGPLRKALDKFQNSEHYRKKCFGALQIDDTSRILDGMRLLDSDFKNTN